METKFDIKSARVRAGMTQKEIADLMNLSLTSYIRYEKGDLILRVDQAWNFSKVVKIPFDQIIFFKSNYTSSVQPA
ncbi:helix-turn-helix transcriptional regulator [Leuconostoc gasicomitatum]|uniref:helix-turn-helix transcriptional regulator n=1 Tax=Leuconostoc gasicomitatum TaxID=115778 RepID=UPI001CC56142|nr:helix-turn-helix transcriptional regulator [Leuconostoc gasicomitatum]MBZ5971635.1 helix-turn-helix transcriptional regulator [Leuconostoc gasicomitatum]